MKEDTTININSGTLNAVVDKVDSALTILADKLGVASDHFYPLFVKQQVLEGWISLGATVPLLLVAIGLTFAGFYDMKKDQEFYGGAFFIGVLFYIGAVVIFSTSLGQAINPEYYALQEVTQLLK